MTFRVVIITIALVSIAISAVSWYIRRRRLLRQLKVSDQMLENLDNYVERQKDGSTERDQNKAS